MSRRAGDVVVGRVISPFGVRGEMKMIVLTDFPERFEVGRVLKLRLRDSAERRVSHIEKSRRHKDGLVVKLEGVESPEDVDLLRGAEVVIDESELSELPSNSFYVFDVIGLAVETEDGRKQGQVVEVLQGGPNDVYVTSTGLCIPALKDVVARIDLERGLMVIRPVAGLLAGD